MILLSPPPLARTLPSKRQATDLTHSLPFSQMSGNTYVTAVYASPPLNLRLSPADQSRMASNGIAITPSHSFNAGKWVGWGMGGVGPDSANLDFGLWSVYFAVTLTSTGPLNLFR